MWFGPFGGLHLARRACPREGKAERGDVGVTGWIDSKTKISVFKGKWRSATVAPYDDTNIAANMSINTSSLLS